MRKPLPAYWWFGCVWFWVCFDVDVVVHRQHTSPHHRRSPSWAGPLKVPSSFSVKRQSMPQIYDESGWQKGQISTPVWDKDFLKWQLFLGRISKAHACWIVLSIVSLFWWFNIWQCGPKCSKGPCWALQENEFHQRRLDFDNWCNRELENQDGSLSQSPIKIRIKCCGYPCTELFCTSIQVLLFATLTPDCQLGHLQKYERPFEDYSPIVQFVINIHYISISHYINIYQEFH